MHYSFYLLIASLLLSWLILSRFFQTVPEGSVGIVTVFGRFHRLLQPGLSFLLPWEKVRNLSIQARAVDLAFQAITLDQANVYFNCTLLYSVADSQPTTVQRAAFSFASMAELQLSIERLLEDETRTYTANKRQAEMIGMSQNVVMLIKQNVDARLAEWGYRIIDLRYHNLRFDEAVMKSMARVVAAVNEREAAEHEGQALLIRKTKDAEANGAFIHINAEAERVAWKLRGQGMAEFRREVAKGVHDAVDELQQAGLDPNYLLFFMYTESLKHIAEHSKAGHTIFLNNHPAMPQDILAQMSTFYKPASMDEPAALADVATTMPNTV
jgi:regulator of protease activity HflC (stomatin/prohibitin superfamily)